MTENAICMKLSGLMLDAQRGDGAALSELLTIVAELLKPYFLRHVCDKSMVDDLIQETLIAIHRGRHTFLADRPFEPWMFSIARNKMIDYLRSRANGGRQMLPLDQVTEHLSVESELEMREQLRQTLSRLTAKQKLVLALLRIHGLTAKSVAAQLGLSESDVKVTAHRAQKLVKASVSA